MRFHLRATASIGVSLLLHLGLALAALSIEPPPPRPPVVPDQKAFARVTVTQALVRLPKPEPVPEPKPEHEPEPKPEPKPVRKKKKAQKPKPKPPAPVEAPVVEPAPLIVSNLSLGGGIQVAAGDEDVLGDPAVAPTDKHRKTATAPSDDSKGTDGKRAPRARLIPPRPSAKNRRTVPWPEGIPLVRKTFAVELSLRVKPDGSVGRIRVVRGVGDPFDTAAKSFARALRFEPATRNGKAVATTVPWEICWNCD